MTIPPIALPGNDPIASASKLSTETAMKLQSEDFVGQFRSLLREEQDRTKSKAAGSDDPELRKAFTDFVGQTLFGRLIASMRATQQAPAYMHGGQAEKIFQNQFDQLLAEEMTKSSADTLADPMYELFRANRSE
jgi:flagellar protein FlgJ